MAFKWELYDKYQEQQKTLREAEEALKQKVEEAWKHLQQCEREYEEMRFRELRGDVTEEKRIEAREKREKAREALEAALEQQRKGPVEENEEMIEPKQLIEDWNQNILPKIKERKIAAICEQMKKARLAYYKALKKYYEIEKECRERIDEMTRLDMERALRTGQFIKIAPFPGENELP